MKIGLDYHGVITANPKLFSRLSAIWYSAGVEVHIITGSKITDEFKRTLEGYVINYTHLFSISDYHHKLGTSMKGYDENKTYIDQDIWDRTKGDYCYRENIDIHIDDCEKYGEYFRTPFVLMDNKKKKYEETETEIEKEQEEK